MVQHRLPPPCGEELGVGVGKREAQRAADA